MKLLAFDTATEACSAALSLDGVVTNAFEICPQQHSQRILPMIDELLTNAQITMQEIDYLVFGRGPGSFTGVRIATGIAQGLALGSDCKIVGISTMAAMAQQVIEIEQAQHVAVAIDARMGEVYFSQYENRNGIASLTSEEAVLAPEAARVLLTTTNTSVAGTGWQAYSLLAESMENSLPTVHYPDAQYMLPLAGVSIAEGQVTTVDDVQPVYLRDKVTWKKLPGRD